MEYINIKEAAERWGVTPRRVQELCARGDVDGAVHFGRAWMIPKDTAKPRDKRTKTAKEDGRKQLSAMPMPKKTPLLIYTDLYSIPGTADSVVEALADQPEAAKILHSQFEYNRGNIDAMYEDVQHFLKAHSGFNAVIGAGIQLAMCAMWNGDVALWRQAKQHAYSAPCANEAEREVLSFWLASIDSSIFDAREFPEWFKTGNFEYMHPDTYPSARIFYARYLLICAHMLAKGELTLRDVEGLGLMRTLPYIIEPMISQSVIEQTLLPQIYLRLMAAVAYHDLGENEKAIPHIDRAIELCLPDGFYCPLVLYRRELDTLLDDRLLLVGEDALKKVKELHKRMITGWTKVHNTLLERNNSISLTAREREVAKLAAFGLGNAEIAARLHIELSSVKRYIFSAMNKVGAEKRSELGLYI